MHKPPVKEFAVDVGLTEKQLEEWMDTPFWESCVQYAVHIEEQKTRRRMNAPLGKGIPKHLLEQAVVLWLAGWSRPYIAPMVGRKERTLRDWQKTVAWMEMEERVMLDKIRMSLINNHLTLRQIISEVAERHESDFSR